MTDAHGRSRSDTDPVIVLSIHPEPESIREARQLIARVAGAAGAPPERVDDLVIAVSEACTNAMESHHAVDDLRAVDLEVVRSQDELVVTVEDRGRGFDVDDRAPRPPLGHADHLQIERGWGLDMMRALVDHFSIERTPLGTRVRLVIDLPPIVIGGASQRSSRPR